MSGRATRGYRPAVAMGLTLMLALACSDVHAPPEAEPADTPGPTGSPEAPQVSDVIVSNPAGSGGVAIGSDQVGSSVRIDIVYASLAPGTIPEGERIVIRARATGAEVGTVLINGGFDPIAIPATVGDTLDVRLYLTDQTEPEESISVVPERRPPVLVRVDPTPGRRDVPLNVVLLLVFSEPIDGSTLTPSSVSLSRDGAPVAGVLAFGDPARLAVKFTPSEDLAVGTDYTLRVTPALRDQDGEALGAQVAVTFTTVDSPADPPVDPQDPVGPVASELAFVRDGRIHVVNADGTDLIRLSDGPADGHPAWSPDRRRIAFMRAADESGWAWDLFVMDADGSNVVRRTHDMPLYDSPAWSPDGTRIAVAAFGVASLNGLHLVTPDDDGTNTTPFMTRQGVNTQPAWSPDGTQLAFASDWVAFDYIYDIFVTTPDGSQVTQLTHGFQVPGPLAHSAYPAWSPDGSLIAFVHGRQFGGPDMRFHVSVMATDGSSVMDLAWAGDVSWFDLLLPGPGSLTWSPDGKGIAYTFVDCDLVTRTGCSKERSVKYVSVDGSEQYTMATNAHSPAWPR